MKIQKLVFFLLCFLNCISLQCMEKNKKENLCLANELFPGSNLDVFFRDTVGKFYKIYEEKCSKSVENFKEKLSAFLKKDPVFLQDNPNICYNISFELLMVKFATFFSSEEEVIEGFLERWREFLK